MSDIVKRLKGINNESLIMSVVRDCMDAAEEIEALRAECAAKSTALKDIKTVIRREELASTEAEKSKDAKKKATKSKKDARKK